MSEHINLAFAGLGVLKLAPNPSPSPTETEDLDELERLTITELLKPLHINRDLLMKEGAIGELSYNFFDSTGNSTPNWDIFLTARTKAHSGLDFYRSLISKGCPVVVMAGARKDFVLRKALTIGDKFFNVLITDSQTATRLLENPKH